MEYRKLGNTDIDVSAIGLGTMTYGEQNSEKEAHAQLDYAVSQGINFIDAAEMYPVPARAETQGLTEAYIGNWLAGRGARDRLVVATKVSGPDMQPYLRTGPRLSAKQVIQAAEDSLRRLKTDYIDLYQVHWPERAANYFGKLGYQCTDDSYAIPIEETLGALAKLVDSGKVRRLGVSNETPWGVAEYLRLSGKHGWPRIVSIQNPYSLLNRVAEVGLAEFAHRDKISLLAYSPLAFGMLSGKYLDGAKPPKARLTLFDHFVRYTGAAGVQATRNYVELARENGISPAAMSLAYVSAQAFVTSTIIGATTMEQLRENISSLGLRLRTRVREGIERIHQERPNPCP